jgi:hypothetical protein
VDEPAVLSVRLPGAANSGPLTVERCLQSGERYAWSIRALGNGKGPKWSRPEPVRSRGERAPADLADAVAELRREMASAGTNPSVRGGGSTPSATEARAAAPNAASASPSVTTFDVDGSGNVVANSFTGSGAALTGVVAATASALAANPGDCTAGNSPLGIAASGAAEGCFDVTTQTELNTHKTSTDHDARYALLGHNHTGVYLSTTGGTLSGGLTINGGLKWNCPWSTTPSSGLFQMDRVGTWCVDAQAAGQYRRRFPHGLPQPRHDALPARGDPHLRCRQRRQPRPRLLQQPNGRRDAAPDADARPRWNRECLRDDVVLLQHE